MRKLSTLFKKSKDKLSDDVLNGLRAQTCLPNEVAPRLKATIPGLNPRDMNSSWGLLVFGPEYLFFFLTKRDADLQSAVPEEEDVMQMIPLSSIAAWNVDRKCLIVTTESGTTFQFQGDSNAIDLSLWCKEAVAMLDFQMLRHQREAGGGSSFSLLLAFLENKDDFSEMVRGVSNVFEKPENSSARRLRVSLRSRSLPVKKPCCSTCVCSNALKACLQNQCFSQGLGLWPSGLWDRGKLP